MLESDQDFKTSFFMFYSSAVNCEKFPLLQMVFFKGDYLDERESTSTRTFQMGSGLMHRTPTQQNRLVIPDPTMRSIRLKLTPYESALQPTVSGHFVGIVNVLT
jgi:hypothetical protein